MASPSSYKFFHGEDPNDEGELRKALGAVRLGKPGTAGGRFQDDSNQVVQYESFNIHTPPDVTPKTRIIAVLGIAQEKAMPQVDGWFVSDFFAFWNIFHGTTSSQTWMHSLDLDELVRQHTHYLHGNPYKSRRVVLDSDILKRAQSGNFPLVRVPRTDLKKRFQQRIREECTEAEKSNANVLLLIFGHGQPTGHGIDVGETGDNGRSTFKIKELRSVLKGVKANVTLLTTAFFSGGWTCHPLLNISTMTAAGREEMKKSWRKSGSSGRASGSMFATAIIQGITKSSATGRPLGEAEKEGDDSQEVTEQQEATMTEFSRSVYESLLQDIDRRGNEHGITFGAKDDAWSMCWRDRTGIPLVDFRKRWEGLQEWPPDVTLLPGDPLNRDPFTTDQQKAEYLRERSLANSHSLIIRTAPFANVDATGTVLGKRKVSALYGGAKEALIRIVCRLGADYLSSYQGNDDTGDDGALHYQLSCILNGKETDLEEVEEAHRALVYRMGQMSTADAYIELMVIPAPKGQQCHEFDTNKIGKEIGVTKLLDIMNWIDERKILFPWPHPDQGRPFYKGMRYLAAAFHNAGTTKEAITEKLDALTKIVEQDLDQQKEIVKRDPEVISKRAKLFQSFGEALREMSPAKRRSRSQSLIGSKVSGAVR